MIPIDRNSYRAVRNFGERVRFLVIHFTAANFKKSVELLTQGGVSAHYLIPDPSDPSYREKGNTDIKILNLVDEKDRAWHAGVSFWRGRNNLNDTSIGVEIVNLATDDGQGHFTFPPFHPQQITAVKQLAANIIQRYPDISPVNVIGHSDIAPGRKSDPGAAFPWQQLSEAGAGAWYDESTKVKYTTQFSQTMPSTDDIISKLKTYGYDVAGVTRPSGLKDLIRAFQLHFRPADYSGKIDVETAAILYALVEKYT
ncbi:N-acetylmuramoyl-L-alanine amidase [Klebsiella sp. BIGb0407]|uniref:N-acetylmuramoyl-L-alanine amidase n=1 Tax=Klebsiella sp. BIGb0407 TaxID=2940603 RepID=UPI00216961ED|nr:N-acetylmuramoyl-L-alanine amidase [Klebsiella sp. BIGb0407]